jgi:hypothetical protein
LFTYAAEPDCDDELVIDGVLFARSAGSFPPKFWDSYKNERRQEMGATQGRIIARGDHSAVTLMARMIQHLAENSGLAPYLNNPAPIHIRFVQNEETLSLPESRISHGVLTINQEMIDILQTDDELAALAADALLRHALAHDLLMAKPDTMVSRLINAVRRTEPPDFDQEVRLALPMVLRNAGHTPWAFVVLQNNILNHNVKFGERVFPVSEAEELHRDTELMIARLKALRIRHPARRPGSVMLEHLKALLRGED